MATNLQIAEFDEIVLSKMLSQAELEHRIIAVNKTSEDEHRCMVWVGVIQE